MEKWVVLGNPIYCKAVARLPNKSDRESAMIGSIFGNKSILVSNHSHHARMKKYFYNIFSMRNIRDHHFKSIAKVVNDWAIPYIQQNSYEAIKGLDVGLGISFRTIISTTFGIDVINNTNECNECIEKID